MKRADILPHTSTCVCGQPVAINGRMAWEPEHQQMSPHDCSHFCGAETKAGHACFFVAEGLGVRCARHGGPRSTKGRSRASIRHDQQVARARLRRSRVVAPVTARELDVWTVRQVRHLAVIADLLAAS